jgi:phosphotransferase system HPr (HPr) family protein
MVKKVTIPHPSKFQIRTLSEFQKTASRFKSRIQIQKGKVVVDAKSFVEIIGLLAAKGNNLEITAEGGDAREAIMALLVDLAVKTPA